MGLTMGLPEFFQPDPCVLQLAVDLQTDLCCLGCIEFPEQAEALCGGKTGSLPFRDGKIFRVEENTAAVDVLIVEPTVVHPRKPVAVVGGKDIQFLRLAVPVETVGFGMSGKDGGNLDGEG